MLHVTKLAIANAVLFVSAALVLLVAPMAVLAPLSIPAPSFGVLALARVLAAVLLVFGAMVWGSRHWLASHQAAGTLRLVSLAYAMAALLAMSQQVAIWNGGLGLSVCVTLAVFAIGYGSLAWRTPRPAPAAPGA